jgi:hypothetical protein
MVLFGLWCGAMWTAVSAYWLIATDHGPITVSSPLDIAFVLAAGPGIVLAWIGERAYRSGLPIELGILAEVLAIGLAIAAVTIHLLRRAGA